MSADHSPLSPVVADAVQTPLDFVNGLLCAEKFADKQFEPDQRLRASDFVIF